MRHVRSALIDDSSSRKDTLLPFLANLHRRFHLTVFRTDHKEHSFVLLDLLNSVA